MVEGLINNFKSNNRRAGQIHRHKHTLLAAYAKSPAQAQMHINHTRLLIHAAQKSKRKKGLYSVRLCTFPLSSLWRLQPQPVCEGVSWSEGEVLWMGSGLLHCKSHPADWILLASWGQ